MIMIYLYPPKHKLPEIEIDFDFLGIENYLIHQIKFLKLENNYLCFLNKNKKIIKKCVYENNKEAKKEFKRFVFILDFKIIFKDRFAKKI